MAYPGEHNSRCPSPAPILLYITCLEKKECAILTPLEPPSPSAAETRAVAGPLRWVLFMLRLA